jgi:hypothetical protein
MWMDTTSKSLLDTERENPIGVLLTFEMRMPRARFGRSQMQVTYQRVMSHANGVEDAKPLLRQEPSTRLRDRFEARLQSF